MRSMFALVISIVIGSIAACTTTPADELADALKSTDCIAYNPPRGDRGPGAVFQYRNTGGKLVPYPVCQNLYPEDRSVEGKAYFAQQNRSTTLDASFGLELLSGLVRNLDSAKAQLAASNVKSVKIVWGPAQYRSLTDASRFDAAGKVVPLAGNCAAALQELKTANRLNNVYMVQEALQVKSLEVVTDVASNQSASASFNLKKALDLKPEVKATEKDNRTLTVDSPVYVCSLPPVLITDFVPSTALTKESARVSGRAISTDEWRALNR